MNVGAALNAASGSDALKMAVGLRLMSKAQDTEAAQAAALMQDFVQSQQQIQAAAAAPHLGNHLDVRV